MRGRRSQGRETALKILYQLDVTQNPVQEVLQNYLKHHRVAVSLQPFVKHLVEGAAGHLGQIDALLSRHATNWSLARMAMVDRNVLRLATFELLFETETPPKVVINEAVELAKRFGSSDSSKFVNGVLDAIHKEGARPEPSDSGTPPTSPEISEERTSAHGE